MVSEDSEDSDDCPFFYFTGRITVVTCTNIPFSFYDFD